MITTYRSYQKYHEKFSTDYSRLLYFVNLLSNQESYIKAMKKGSIKVTKKKSSIKEAEVCGIYCSMRYRVWESKYCRPTKVEM